MFCVLCSLAPILSKPGCKDAAAKTVSVVRAGPTPHEVSIKQPDGPVLEAHAAISQTARIEIAALITPKLHADVGGLDHGDRRHSGLQAELVDSLTGEK